MARGHSVRFVADIRWPAWMLTIPTIRHLWCSVVHGSKVQWLTSCCNVSHHHLAASISPWPRLLTPPLDLWRSEGVQTVGSATGSASSSTLRPGILDVRLRSLNRYCATVVRSRERPLRLSTGAPESAPHIRCEVMVIFDHQSFDGWSVVLEAL